MKKFLFFGLLALALISMALSSKVNTLRRPIGKLPKPPKPPRVTKPPKIPFPDGYYPEPELELGTDDN